MNQSNNPPTYKEAKETALFFPPGEWAAQLLFYYIRRSAFLRLFVELSAAIAVVFGVIGLYFEFEQRQVDRGVRIATLFAQIAQVHALPDGEGLSSLKPSVLALARENVDMSEINLSGVDLSRVNLSGVTLNGANLSKANLMFANLSGASLLGANLSGAKLNHANLGKASLSMSNFTQALMVQTNLQGADISGANFLKATLMGANLSDVKSIKHDFGFDVDLIEIPDQAKKKELLKMLSDMTLNFEGAFLLGANLSGADIAVSKGLTQKQINNAYAIRPPKLPIDRETKNELKPPPTKSQSVTIKR